MVLPLKSASKYTTPIISLNSTRNESDAHRAYIAFPPGMYYIHPHHDLIDISTHFPWSFSFA